MKKMQLLKTLILAVLLTGSVKASIAAETALPLPTAVPLEASITGASDAQSGGAMRPFAFACGLLAFAMAAQQAFFPVRPAMQRVRAAKD